ncbi:uncharacterized protein LOC100165616 [Acyrthosiphon pisum]|uniref:ACYPI006551 protein n=1 Tax=Acyrthosiphon pisum TaxID=7029 RepID=C4WUR7_ACYPI|nr:uncharacterized protein LOC100165616 [Acyrthosiphon pisum]BAH71637.1 ACYPI006551 [Acyrthosiphon pisum]|eukprot:NP_001233105.1 uncharacterized protein LOC100165616 [Acyrthosiphon pisum]
MNLKFCANLSFMYQETNCLLERYSLAAKSGFTSVECAFPYSETLEKLVQAKTNANVQQILINAPRGEAHELGFAAIPSMEDSFRSSIDLAVSYANALNCSKIHVMAGIVVQPTKVNHEAYEKNLTCAAQIFETKEELNYSEWIGLEYNPKGDTDKGLSWLRDIKRTVTF